MHPTQQPELLIYLAAKANDAYIKKNEAATCNSVHFLLDKAAQVFVL